VELDDDWKDVGSPDEERGIARPATHDGRVEVGVETPVNVVRRHEVVEGEPDHRALREGVVGASDGCFQSDADREARAARRWTDARATSAAVPVVCGAPGACSQRRRLQASIEPRAIRE
jgi:hypothetical protein